MGAILDPKKVIPGSFFRLSAQRRPAKPTDPTQPSPKHPKDPQRHPREPFLEHFGSKKAAQMRPRRCTGDTWSPFLAKILREWAAEVIFEAIWIFFVFQSISMVFLLEFQGKIKSGLKGSDFFSFQFFFLSLPFCFFPVGGRGDFRVVPPYTGGLNLPPWSAVGLSFPRASFFITFFITFFRRHFWCIFWDLLYSFDAYFV